MKKMQRFILLIVAFLAVLVFAGCQLKQAAQQPCEQQPITEVSGGAVTGAEGAENVTKGVEETKTPALNVTESGEKTTTMSEEEYPTKIVTEGELVSFPNLKATDPEGNNLTYSFSAPLSENGTWQTKKGDAGEYLVNISVSDGVNVVTQTVKIIVKHANRAPVIQLAEDIIRVKEGEKVIISPEIIDPDGDNVTVSYSGWMKTNSYETTFNDAGSYNVTITATDGKEATTKTVKIIVENVNRPPVIAPIQDFVVNEGDRITLLPNAKDPDGDKISFVFSPPFDERGVWQTKVGDEGKYRINITASDGELTDKIAFFIVVQKGNQPPQITGLTDITVNEGETVELKFNVTDPEGDSITTKISGWMNSTTYKTTYDDAGVHEVTVTATDGTNTATKKITVTVKDVNRPPVFDPGAFK
ncbi:MAG: Ig-like domain-containing protein [Candidatus Woesearchaeota archaeon]